MEDTKEIILDELSGIDLSGLYKNESAVKVAELIVRSHEYFLKIKSPKKLHNWQMEHIANAYCELCMGWLKKAVVSIELSYEENISQEEWLNEKLEERYNSFKSEIDNSINKLKNSSERNEILKIYKT